MGKRKISINFDAFYKRLLMLALFALIAAGAEKLVLTLVYFLTPLDQQAAGWESIRVIVKLLAGAAAIGSFFYIYRKEIIVYSDDNYSRIK